MIDESQTMIKLDDVLKHYTLVVVRKSKKIITTDVNGIAYEVTPEEYEKELNQKFDKIKRDIANARDF